MIELLNWAFEKGGVWAVVAVALAAVVVYMHRSQRRDARERKREQRQQLKFLIRMAQKLRNGNGQQIRADLPSRPYDPGDEPSVDSEEWDQWDEPTLITQRKQDTAREEIERLVTDYLNNGHGPDSDGD
jgi:hypothetical protein